ncbi:uncharacterized protein [Amphiura filiformis]|uniref:uncharacterized protein n=1 Tax=Amphiura filiformis TaxID=82378 RepID=UPI003B20DB2A
MADNGDTQKQLQSSSATSFCDDSEAKLANQDEEFKLVTTVDNLQSTRVRRRANMAHEKYELKRTLIKLKSQRDLLHKARADNVFQNRTLDLRTPDEHDQDDHESKGHVTFATETFVRNIENRNDDTDPPSTPSNSEYSAQQHVSDKPVLPVTEPVFTRPLSTSSTPSPHGSTDNVRRADDKMSRRRNSSAPAFRARSRMTSRRVEVRRLSGGTALEDVGSTDHVDEELYDIQMKPVTSSERPDSNEFPSLVNDQSQHTQVRPKTASEALQRGRSRRELFRLTHIDAIAAAEIELRRRLWLSQLAEKREIEQAHMQTKINEFIAKVEADKKRFRRAVGADSILNATDFI